ncbi:MAG: hypothetical protein IJH98_10490 [Solobacterium sp.]|nr:hypothetical protein [Solobacterium sp.]
MIFITREELNAYTELKSSVQEIEEQIQRVYESTNRPDNIGGYVSARPAANPTEKKALRIIELREELDRRTEELEELQYRIELFSLEVDNPLIGCLIRLHYIRGLSWRNVGKTIYGDPRRGDACRVATNRYLDALSQKEDEELPASPDSCIQ